MLAYSLSPCSSPPRSGTFWTYPLQRSTGASGFDHRHDGPAGNGGVVPLDGQRFVRRLRDLSVDAVGREAVSELGVYPGPDASQLVLGHGGAEDYKRHLAQCSRAAYLFGRCIYGGVLGMQGRPVAGRIVRGAVLRALG